MSRSAAVPVVEASTGILGWSIVVIVVLALVAVIVVSFLRARGRPGDGPPPHGPQDRPPPFPTGGPHVG